MCFGSRWWDLCLSETPFIASMPFKAIDIQSYARETLPIPMGVNLLSKHVPVTTFLCSFVFQFLRWSPRRRCDPITPIHPRFETLLSWIRLCIQSNATKVFTRVLQIIRSSSHCPSTSLTVCHFVMLWERSSQPLNIGSQPGTNDLAILPLPVRIASFGLTRSIDSFPLGNYSTFITSHVRLNTLSERGTVPHVPRRLSLRPFVDC